MALALVMRQLLWRDEANRLILDAEELSRRVAAQAEKALREIVDAEDVGVDH
jgi:hypothetical protein